MYFYFGVRSVSICVDFVLVITGTLKPGLIRIGFYSEGIKMRYNAVFVFNTELFFPNLVLYGDEYVLFNFALPIDNLL